MSDKKEKLKKTKNKSKWGKKNIKNKNQKKKKNHQFYIKSSKMFINYLFPSINSLNFNSFLLNCLISLYS
jgi:hypothetical protein